MAWLFESAQSDAMFQQMRRQKEEELYYKKNKVQSQEMQMYTQWQSEPMPWDNNKMAPKPWYNSQDSQCQKAEDPWRRCECEHPAHKLKLMAYRIKFLKSTGKCKDILDKMEGSKVCCVFKELKRLKIIT